MPATTNRLSGSLPLLALLAGAVGSLPLWTAASGNPFLWTDVVEISEHGSVFADWPQLLAALRHGTADQHYRPLMFVVDTMSYWLFGDSPKGYRVSNLVLHLFNAVLLYRGARCSGSKHASACITGVLFAGHPLAITPVAWIGDRTDVLALGCALATLQLAHYYILTRNLRWLILSCGFLALGLAAKENTLALLMISCVGVAINQRNRPVLTLLFAQSLTVVVWAVWRNGMLGHTAHNEYAHGLGPGLSLALSAYIHVQYLTELARPWTLRVCDACPIPSLAWIVVGAVPVLALALVLRSAVIRTKLAVDSRASTADRKFVPVIRVKREAMGRMSGRIPSMAGGVRGMAFAPSDRCARPSQQSTIAA